MRNLMLALFLATALTAQDAKRDKMEQWAIAPVVARDPGCAKDLSKAAKLTGVEQRKAVAELLKYGCAEALAGIYHLVPVPKTATAEPAPEAVAGTFWTGLVIDQDLSSLFTDKKIRSEEFFKIGWLLDAAVIKATWREIAAKFTSADRRR